MEQNKVYYNDKEDFYEENKIQIIKIGKECNLADVYEYMGFYENEQKKVKRKIIKIIDLTESLEGEELIKAKYFLEGIYIYETSLLSLEYFKIDD